MRNVVVVGTGSYLPERILTNAELVSRLQLIDSTTNDEWIRVHTGVEERRVAAFNETTSDMAFQAARRCLEKAEVSPEEVDLIVVSTVSGDTVFPATANWLQGELGNKRAWSYDVNAGCSGFIYALAGVNALLKSGASNLALLVGAEKMSALYDPRDRTSFPLAGDGAACMLLRGIEPKTNIGGFGFGDFCLRSDGEFAPVLLQKLGGTKEPLTAENVGSPDRYLQMDGPAVYKAAVRGMCEVTEAVLQKADVTKNEIDWFVGHQANLRILETVAKRLGLPVDKVYSNIQKYGNTTSASIPLCLDEMVESGKLKAGHQLILFTFGTGFTQGACHLTWGN